jgi:hypothetical protein
MVLSITATEPFSMAPLIPEAQKSWQDRSTPYQYQFVDFLAHVVAAHAPGREIHVIAVISRPINQIVEEFWASIRKSTFISPTLFRLTSRNLVRQNEQVIAQASFLPSTTPQKSFATSVTTTTPIRWTHSPPATERLCSSFICYTALGRYDVDVFVFGRRLHGLRRILHATGGAAKTKHNISSIRLCTQRAKTFTFQVGVFCTVNERREISCSRS